MLLVSFHRAQRALDMIITYPSALPKLRVWPMLQAMQNESPSGRTYYDCLHCRALTYYSRTRLWAKLSCIAPPKHENTLSLVWDPAMGLSGANRGTGQRGAVVAYRKVQPDLVLCPLFTSGGDRFEPHYCNAGSVVRSSRLQVIFV